MEEAIPSIFDWSATASSNTTIDSIDVNENCAAAGINNAIRSMAAIIRQTFSSALQNFLSGASALAIANGGTGGNTAAAARTALDVYSKAETSAASTPTGAVLYFAMNAAPTGFLKCNGAAVSRTTYAALFAAIGTTFGAGDGSTTFNLPEMRGEFARGWDDARGVDAGRVFGSTQADELKLHGHPYRSGTTGVSSPDGAGAFVRDANETTNYPAFTGTPSATAGENIGGTGGTETRPRNIALLACIKT